MLPCSLEVTAENADFTYLFTFEKYSSYNITTQPAYTGFRGFSPLDAKGSFQVNNKNNE